LGKKISIQAGPVTVKTELTENSTSDAIWRALPISSTVNPWGKEIYFAIPVTLHPENGQEVVKIGDIAYWPPGKAFCIFFGPNPAIHGKEIRAASAVNVFGRLVDTSGVLSAIKDGQIFSVPKMP
jgi:uncharacterized protein